VISLSVEDGMLDLGDALVGDTISSNFKVRKGSFCTEQSFRTWLFSVSGDLFSTSNSPHEPL